jgi:hypothetical protein
MPSSGHAELVEALEALNAVIIAYLDEFQRTLDDPYRGLYVTVDEVEHVLGVGRVGFQEASSARRGLLEAGIWCTAFESKTQDDPRSPTRIWRRVVEHGRLDRFEQGVLLLCLAPEIDLRYERIYGYLHDDVTRKRPSVELALNLLCTTLDERLRRRGSVTGDGALIHWGLVEVTPPEPQQALLSAPLRLSDRGLDLLLGRSGCGGLPSWARIAGDPGVDLCWVRDTAQRALDTMQAIDRIATIRLDGPDAFHRRCVAQAIASALDRSLLCIDAPALVAAPESPELAARRIRCEQLRDDVLLYFDGIESVTTESHPAWVELLRGDLLLGTRAVLGSAGGQVGAGTLPAVSVAVGPLPRSQREQLWSAAAGADRAAVPSSAPGLAARLPLTTEELVAAGKAVSALSLVRDVDLDDVEDTCRAYASPRADRLANRVTNRYGWADLVLPAPQMSALRDLCRQIRLEARVLDDWGFGAKSRTDRGVAAMFCGPPGTGKTMAASIVAHDLGLDLFRIDASKLVSKYIGETEKNLARLFDETERATTCLFFDEADAIFAKRSEVKDSHDRYANLETSYLLQRIEEFEGLVILATNFRNNIDPAFLRRLSHVVGFPMPEVDQRRRLWRSMLPPEAPVCADLDLDFFARTFCVAGGHIRNIVLAAAFLAAAEERSLRTGDLVRATMREFQKIGHSCSVAEFGPYGALLDPGADVPTDRRPFVVPPREAS